MNLFCLAAVLASATTSILANAVSDTEADDLPPIDLSQELAEDASAMSSSPGALAVKEVASSDPLMRAAMVLEKGNVVAKYFRDDVDEDAPFQVWSVTKSWTSLLIGLLVDEGLLSIDETLGDIFLDESAWADIADGTVDFRKAVTIFEMLTMTSGLVTPAMYSSEAMVNMTIEEVGAAMGSVLTGGGTTAGGGSSLSESLAFPEIGDKGEFSYLAASNILSYVIKERSGKTPREMLQDKVMPALGIEDQYNWLSTLDGVEFSFHGLELTVPQMVKFGQLYLQGGAAGSSSETKLDTGQIISKDWIDDSFKPYASDYNRPNAMYGYLFWNVGPSMWCAVGAMGQDICIDRQNSRVIVQQRDGDTDNMMDMGNFKIALVASTMPFTAAEEELSLGTSPDTAAEEGSSLETSQEINSAGPLMQIGLGVGLLAAQFILSL